ncbi:MAG: hypothetical protein ACOYPR_09975 [Saprospiraceae bacterium]
MKNFIYLSLCIVIFLNACSQDDNVKIELNKPELAQLLDTDTEVKQYREMVNEYQLLIASIPYDSLQFIYSKLKDCGLYHSQGTVIEIQKCIRGSSNAEAFIEMERLNPEIKAKKVTIRKKYPELSKMEEIEVSKLLLKPIEEVQAEKLLKVLKTANPSK